MQREYETQVLEFDEDEVIKTLRKLGAKEEPEILQKRWVLGNNENGNWIRLRESGGKTTLCHKKKLDKSISGTREIEVEVGDFDKMADLLMNLELFKEKYYQENKRKLFELDGIEFTIDSWPLIPKKLEIEGKSEAKVRDGLELIGLAGKDEGHIGMKEIYRRHGLDIHSFERLTFDTKPTKANFTLDI